MIDKKPAFVVGTVDVDDAPEWTDAMFDVAEFSVGGEVVRPATGYLDQSGVAHRQPPRAGRLVPGRRKS